MLEHHIYKVNLIDYDNIVYKAPEHIIFKCTWDIY